MCLCWGVGKANGTCQLLCSWTSLPLISAPPAHLLRLIKKPSSGILQMFFRLPFLCYISACIYRYFETFSSHIQSKFSTSVLVASHFFVVMLTTKLSFYICHSANIIFHHIFNSNCIVIISSLYNFFLLELVFTKIYQNKISYSFPSAISNSTNT